MNLEDTRPFVLKRHTTTVALSKVSASAKYSLTDTSHTNTSEFFHQDPQIIPWETKMLNVMQVKKKYVLDLSLYPDLHQKSMGPILGCDPSSIYLSSNQTTNKQIWLKTACVSLILFLLPAFLVAWFFIA